ncbi:MAG: SusC/RagA family TonB-linked outer membrane protein [Rikenellaceae bacterium]
MKKIRLLALLFLGLVANVALAQNVRVTGVVTSSEDGLPLPGVTIFIQGTGNGAGTSADGSYTLNNVPSKGTLEFRYVGMKTQVVAVNGRTKIDVAMEADAMVADEAVVTALGVRKQNRALGYATTTVDGEELARTNQINPINSLQGKVAGVQVQSTGSGGVTSAPAITIRGAKSLTKSNSPIFVVDGIVLQNTEEGVGSYGNSSGTYWADQINSINPNDIETQTVLKGAAATSMYGSRGANGAIVITTKRGKSRKGVGIEVSYTHEFQDVYANSIALQDVYGAGDPYNGYQGGYIDAYQSYSGDSYDSWSYGARMEGQMVNLYYKGDGYGAEPYVPYPDNWKAYYQTGQYDNANIAITGGTDAVTYRLAYSYTKSQGTSPTNDYSRHNIDFSTTGKVNDIISIDASIKYSKSVTANPTWNNIWYNGGSGVMLTAYYVNRSTDIQWIADNYIDPVTFERKSLGIGSTITDYFNSVTDTDERRYDQTIIAKVGVTFNFTDFLDASASVSLNDYGYFQETKTYGSTTNRAGGSYYIANSQSGSYDGLAQIHYGDTFVDDRLTVDVRVMSEIYGNTASYGGAKSTNGGLITPGLFNFSNSANALTTSNISAWYTPRNTMTIGVAGILSVDWDNQIYLEVTGRNDWMSSLLYPDWIPQGSDNYSVFYPSVNASWVFSDTFQIDPAILSFGKLRASWAQVGMGTSAYYTASGTGGYTQGTLTTPDESSIIYASANNSTLPNYDLKPEIQQSIEIGADLRFLDDRIGVDIAYYKTNTFNQIMSLSAASESGVGSQLINAGNIQNQGWEIQLDFTPIRTRDLTWNISANWTRNRGKIVELHEDIKNLCFMWGTGYSAAIYGFEGGAFGQVIAGNGWGTNYTIATQNDPDKAHYGKAIVHYYGNISWTGSNGEEVFRYMPASYMADYYNDTDHQYDVLGNVEPDFYFGITTNLSYKNFDFFAQIDGRVGGMVLSPSYRYAMSAGSTEASLYGRDAEYGGVARLNYKGETVYNGLILDGVFSDYYSTVTSLKTGESVSLSGMTYQEAIDAGHIQAMNASAYYYYQYPWACAADYQAQECTYVLLRELTVGYNFSENIVKHVGMQSARLSFSARNLCYIYNGMEGNTNPESLSSNNALTPYDYGGIPFTRYYSLTLNVRF